MPSITPGILLVLIAAEGVTSQHPSVCGSKGTGDLSRLRIPLTTWNMVTWMQLGRELANFGGAQLGCFDGSLSTDSKATGSSSPGLVLGEPTVVLGQQTMQVV